MRITVKQLNPDRRPSRLRLRALFSSSAGTSIVEAAIASGVICIAFAGMFQVSVRSMGMLKAQSEMAVSAQTLQERIDYLRSLPYGQLTTSKSYTDYPYTVTDPDTGASSTENWTGLMKTLPVAAGLLDTPKETITISGYPSGGTPITIVNQTGSHVVTPVAGSNLSAQAMVRVDTRLEWKEGRSKRDRVQEASFIIAQQGVGK